MASGTYRSEVRVTRGPGSARTAWLPTGGHLRFDAPGLDHLVATTVACLLESFTRALEAHGVATGAGRLEALGVGEAEPEARVLVLRRVHVRYRLAAAEGTDRDLVEAVLAVHADACPVFRSISPQVRVTTALETVDSAEADG